jgi:hypothetical protein
MTDAVGGRMLTASKFSSVIDVSAAGDTIALPSGSGNGNYDIDGGPYSSALSIPDVSTDYAVVPYGDRYLLQDKAGLNGVSIFSNISQIRFSDGTAPIADANSSAIAYQSGADALLLAGDRASYLVSADGKGGVTISDAVPGRNGSHDVGGFAQLIFADKTLFVVDANQAQVARLYSAAFDRAPDEAGLAGWEKLYADALPSSAKVPNVFVPLAETNLAGYSFSVAGGFTDSTEFKNRYGVLDDTQFAATLYENVLSRVPDANGLNGWLSLMHDGDSNGLHYTREMVLVGFAESPENIAKTAGDWLFQV